MADDEETLPKTYTQIVALLAKLNKEKDINERTATLENNILDRQEIDRMIWSRIKQHQKNEDRVDEAANKNKINWIVIIQGVIITVAAGIILAHIIKGGA